MLRNKTGLRGTQITNWLANARRRGKYGASSTNSPAEGHASSSAVNIPQSRTSWDLMNPLERWKHSPPEHEPASVTAIANAMASTEYRQAEGTSSEDEIRDRQESGDGSSISLIKASSSNSFGTAISSGSVGSVESLALSHGSHSSVSSLSSLTRKDTRRRRRPLPRTPRKDAGREKRPYKCTFCTDSFRSKYDWARHEKSLHISLEKWICAPLGPVTTSSTTGNQRCVYCGELEPSQDHLENHNHNSCEEKGISARTFYRKDHLRQHLRLVHECKLTEYMESWKILNDAIKSRCGFCAKDFDRWQDRADHLGKHFRDGYTVRKT